MFSVTVIAIGRLKERWLREGLEEYRKRLAAYCDFQVAELPEYRLPDAPSPAQIQKGLEEEGRAILERVGKTPFAALCIEGKELDSPELSRRIQKAAVEGKSEIVFIIGGSFGLWEQVKARTELRLSMSPMTFPHQLARVMLCEQIYRAFSIAANTKYHK